MADLSASGGAGGASSEGVPPIVSAPFVLNSLISCTVRDSTPRTLVALVDTGLNIIAVGRYFDSVITAVCDDYGFSAIPLYE